MNFNQFGMTNSIVSGVEDVEVRIMSILHSQLHVGICISRVTDLIPTRN